MIKIERNKLAIHINVCKVKVTENKRHSVAASLMLTACLVVEIIHCNADVLPLPTH